MSTAIDHRHGLAVFPFSCELSWANAFDSVGTVDLVVDVYLCLCIELTASWLGAACPVLVDTLGARACPCWS